MEDVHLRLIDWKIFSREFIMKHFGREEAILVRIMGFCERLLIQFKLLVVGSFGIKKVAFKFFLLAMSEYILR
jgi:hypothetical protein